MDAVIKEYLTMFQGITVIVLSVSVWTTSSGATVAKGNFPA